VNGFLDGVERAIDSVGGFLVKSFHNIALFAIGGAIAWAAWETFFAMAVKRHFSVEDILLLFIYLELGAMVGIYFKTAKLPVRFLIYVAITALTRMMIAIINVEHKADMGIVLVSGSILILAIAAQVVRYGSYHMPLDTGVDELSDHKRLPNSAKRQGPAE
jgi:phosphate starvation-inducible membrane PsiE